MSHDDDAELFALALLHALDGDEGRAVIARLEARAPQDVPVIARAEALLASIGASAVPEAPPAGARERLLARIAHDAPEVRSRARASSSRPPQPVAPAVPPRRTRFIVPAVLGVAFLALAILNAVQGLRPSAQAPDAEITSLLLDPAGARWVIKDTGPASRPMAIAVGDARQKRFFFVANRLPAPPKDRSYVLWTISKQPGSAPKNVGAIRTSTDARVVVEVSASGDLAEIDTVAVSVESDPSTSAPTDIVAAGKAP